MRETNYGIPLWISLIYWVVCRKFYPYYAVYALFVLAGLWQTFDALGVWGLLPDAIHSQDPYTLQDNFYKMLALVVVINNASWKASVLVTPIAILLPYFL
jgi:hypothetical protein